MVPRRLIPRRLNYQPLVIHADSPKNQTEEKAVLSITGSLGRFIAGYDALKKNIALHLLCTEAPFSLIWDNSPPCNVSDERQQPLGTACFAAVNNYCTHDRSVWSVLCFFV